MRRRLDTVILLLLVLIGAGLLAAGFTLSRFTDSSIRLPAFLLLSGSLIIIVSLCFVVGWWRYSHTPFRWFWAGAAVWTAAIIMKSLVSSLVTPPLLPSLSGTFPWSVYLTVGALYLGLLTGIFEVGLTLIAGLTWPQLADTGKRAVTIGLGAGAFEALLLGMGGVVSAILVFTHAPGSNLVEAGVRSTAVNTDLFWLVGPAERAIAILCHTAARTLTLYSVATKRWVAFGWGFLLLTGLDAVAGYYHLSTLINRISLWWIELSLLPFAIISIPFTLACLRGWPTAPPQEKTSPDL